MSFCASSLESTKTCIGSVWIWQKHSDPGLVFRDGTGCSPCACEDAPVDYPPKVEWRGVTVRVNDALMDWQPVQGLGAFPMTLIRNGW